MYLATVFRKQKSFPGDLYEEQDILNWLLTQKDPSGDVIDEVNGDDLLKTIQESEALAVYFCKTNFKFTICFY